MIKSLMQRLRLRKATDKDIEKILQHENIIFTQGDTQKILAGNKKAIRYGGGVFKQKNGNHTRNIFLKILIDGTWKTYVPFKRQVTITKTISEIKNDSFAVTHVFSSNLHTRVPYAVFETRETGKSFGFMSDSEESYNSLSNEDIHAIAETMFTFHNILTETKGINKKSLQKISSKVQPYKKYIHQFLSTKVHHKTKDGKSLNTTIEKLLSMYLGREKVVVLKDEVSKALSEVIQFTSPHKKILVHADFQIDNVYKSENGTFEPLDFEWVGYTDNHAIAIMYDYGNLRSRAWSAPSFQKSLDKAVNDVGCKVLEPEVVRLGVTLGKLYYGIMMARFHLDYTNTVIKDKHSEERYCHMYAQTVNELANFKA